MFWAMFACDMERVLAEQPPDTWDSFPLFQVLNDYLRMDGKSSKIYCRNLPTKIWNFQIIWKMDDFTINFRQFLRHSLSDMLISWSHLLLNQYTRVLKKKGLKLRGTIDFRILINLLLSSLFSFFFYILSQLLSHLPSMLLQTQKNKFWFCVSNRLYLCFELLLFR